MAITLNGSTGITNDGGYTGDGIVFADNTPSNTLVTDTSGNVGVGVAPAAWSVFKAAQVNTAAIAGTTTGQNTVVTSNTFYDGSGYKYITNGFAGIYQQNSGAHTWSYAASGTAGNAATFVEAARIDSSGQFMVGTASANAKFFVRSASTGSGFNTVLQNSAATTLLYIREDGVINTGTASLSPYNLTTGAGANMHISADGTLYRSTSSLKYKTAVQDAVHGLDKVMQLRPVTYKGNNDGELVFGGLIAEEVHEAGLSEFVQYAEDGTPDALAYANMVSLAFKAIQELNAKVDAQAAEIAALKAAA